MGLGTWRRFCVGPRDGAFLTLLPVTTWQEAGIPRATPPACSTHPLSERYRAG